MKRRFVISDFHFGHESVYSKFKDENGISIRPWALNSDEGDEIMIEAYNSIVKNADTCYILGDIAIPRKALEKCSKLNGRKILIGGNHDHYGAKEYLKYFEDIRAGWKIGNLLLSHYPIHSASIPHWCIANVHGHTHQRKIRIPILEKNADPGSTDSCIYDPRYINVCVEQSIYPTNIESITGFKY